MTIENELRHVHAEGRMGRTPDFAAIAANITALSARASAGEGGECPAWALMKGDEFVNVSRAHDGETPDSALPTFLRGAIRSVKEAKRQGYHVVPARVVIDTTTPQPAQAGASGGSVDDETVKRAMDAVLPNGHRVWAYVAGGNPDPSVSGREVMRVALEAVAGTRTYRDAYEGAREDLLDWKGRALRAESRLRSLGWQGIDASEPPAPTGVADECETCGGLGWIDETLGGHSFSNPKAPCPDCDGHGEIAAAPQPQEVPVQECRCIDDYVCDRCNEQTSRTVASAAYDTPPAHGDVEGDDLAMHAKLRDLLAGKSLYVMGREHFDQRDKPLYEIVFGMAMADKILFSAKDAGYLTTRPTPEAQEARDAVDARRYRYLRDHCKREWYSDMPHNKGAPSLDIEFEARGHDLDAAIDAALALPAQGEGSC